MIRRPGVHRPRNGLSGCNGGSHSVPGGSALVASEVGGIIGDYGCN